MSMQSYAALAKAAKGRKKRKPQGQTDIEAIREAARKRLKSRASSKIKEPLR